MYTTVTILELYDIHEMPYGTFTLSFKLIYHYHQEHPFLFEKLKPQNIKRVFSWRPEYYKLIMHKDKIVVPQKIQKYVVKWYHMYLLHPGMDRAEAMITQNL